MTDVRWQAAATCVPPPGIGASLTVRSIELSGRLSKRCWYPYKAMDAWADCGTTS